MVAGWYCTGTGTSGHCRCNDEGTAGYSCYCDCVEDYNYLTFTDYVNNYLVEKAEVLYCYDDEKPQLYPDRWYPHAEQKTGIALHPWRHNKARAPPIKKNDREHKASLWKPTPKKLLVENSPLRHIPLSSFVKPTL